MRRRLFWAMVTVAFVTLVIAGVSGAVLVERSLSQEREEEFFRQAAATGRLIENLVDAGDRPVGAARQVCCTLRYLPLQSGVGDLELVSHLIEGSGEASKFVCPLNLNPLFQVSSSQTPGNLGQPLVLIINESVPEHLFKFG